MLISCIEHIINLATQALIKARSTGAFFDPTKGDHPLPSTAVPRNGSHRDEIAIVRAYGVKVGFFSAAFLSGMVATDGVLICT